MYKINLGNYGDTYTTKEYAKQLNTNTSTAYKILCILEKQGEVIKFGYYNGYGTDDVNNSKRHFQSLIWQTIGEQIIDSNGYKIGRIINV